MKKTISILVVGILVLSGLGAVALTDEHPEILRNVKISESITFSKQPEFEGKDEYLRVNFEGATSWLINPGYPELPIYVKTFILPQEAKNIRIECIPKETSSMIISGEIIPVVVLPLNSYDAVNTPLVRDEHVYMSDELYPDSWFSYNIGRGLNDGDRVTFVKIVCNVIRYSPALNRVEYMNGVDIKVTYVDESITNTYLDEYDMVIIAPEVFSSAYQPLIDHKEAMGVKTMLKTVENILDEYEGYDAPEKIKYFIKDAIEMYNITYVLLGGGLRSHIFANDRENRNTGTKAWHVPARYTNIVYGGDPGCLSDLYYADIYDSEGNFSSWDSNENGIYAEYLADSMDLYPDVYVSRLACRKKFEVNIMVKKIINYESTTPDSKSWFKTMIGVTGKTFSMYNGQPDGEYITDTMIDHMGDLVDEAVKVYASNRDNGGLVPSPKDIKKAISSGAGFVTFMGHGNPFSWNTHWVDEGWSGGLSLQHFPMLFNGKKLPVVIVGGCHNGMFNISLLAPLLKSGYWTSLPTPFCFSWGLLLIPWGGAIASTGCTGLGIGTSGGNPITLSAEMETNFFYEIGQNNAMNLAQAHGDAISKFMNENSLAHTEYHCITIFQLFGDPSMKFGGYE